MLLPADDLFARYFLPLQGADGSCSQNEFRALFSAVIARAPCRMLVFGCGRDSPGWLAANRGGRTVFLEDSEPWARQLRQQLPGAEIHVVSYPRFRESRTLKLELFGHHRAYPELEVPLPPELRELSWDILFIDGPKGQTYGGPGRQASLYEGSRLAAPHSLIAVHDLDRELERRLCAALFDPFRPHTQIERLRLYGPIRDAT